MKIKGKIVSINGDEKYYTLKSDNSEDHILFFEELEGRKFLIGDIISFNSFLTSKYGLCAIDTEKITNSFFEELKIKLAEDEYVNAYVYDTNEGGYLVSYNGYRCFAPFSENYEEILFDLDEIVNSYQIFKVKEIKDNSVILSKKEINKKKLRDLELKERNNLEIGQVFRGKVKRVQGFGIFITNTFSSGLVHTTKLSNIYNSNLSKKQKEKIENSLNKIFTKGLEVDVQIEQISNAGYSLNIIKDSIINKNVLDQLKEYKNAESNNI